jgi:hypothetical protein
MHGEPAESREGGAVPECASHGAAPAAREVDHGQARRLRVELGREHDHADEGSAQRAVEGGALHAIAVTSAPNLASRPAGLPIQPRPLSTGVADRMNP